MPVGSVLRGDHVVIAADLRVHRQLAQVEDVADAAAQGHRPLIALPVSLGHGDPGDTADRTARGLGAVHLGLHEEQSALPPSAQGFSTAMARASVTRAITAMPGETLARSMPGFTLTVLLLPSGSSRVT